MGDASAEAAPTPPAAPPPHEASATPPEDEARAVEPDGGLVWESQTSPPAPAAAAEENVQMSSGQGWLRKARFSASITSPLACGAVVFFAKDVYILEMGADVQMMGFVGIFLAVWAPLCSPVCGYFMERDLLVRCFPWTVWGRRAPWFLTHSVVMAVATAAVYVPPSMNSLFLCMWYLVFGTILSWVLAVLCNCFEAARAELYPTKEERSEVEAIVKVTAGLGSALGMGPQLLIAAGASFRVRAISSGAYLIIALLSLVGLPIFRLARQAYDPSKISSFWKEMYSLLMVPACRHFFLYRLVESIANTLTLQGALYYLTFVAGQTGEARSFYLLLAALMAGLGTAIVLPVWAWFFRVRRPINTNVVCGLLCCMGALCPLVLLLGHRCFTPAIGFLLYTLVSQVSWSGQTYWRCIAIGWLVDEDCQSCDGRRREAVFVGVVSLVSAIGRSIAVAIVINGLGSVGLDTVNCQDLCNKGTSDAESRAVCVEACEKANYTRQPQAVRDYAESLYYALAPTLQLLTGLLTIAFPIYGERLDRIYQSQARRFHSTAGSRVLPSPIGCKALASEDAATDGVLGEVAEAVEPTGRQSSRCKAGAAAEIRPPRPASGCPSGHTLAAAAELGPGAPQHRHAYVTSL